MFSLLDIYNTVDRMRVYLYPLLGLVEGPKNRRDAILDWDVAHSTTINLRPNKVYSHNALLAWLNVNL